MSASFARPIAFSAFGWGHLFGTLGDFIFARRVFCDVVAVQKRPHSTSAHSWHMAYTTLLSTDTENETLFNNTVFRGTLPKWFLSFIITVIK